MIRLDGKETSNTIKEEIKVFETNHGWKCLSEVDDNISKRLTWKCSSGHTIQRTIYNLRKKDSFTASSLHII